MEKQLDWLLVGTGDIVKKRVAPALAACPRARLLGIVGQQDRARELAAAHAIPNSYGYLHDALRETSARAIYIATPVFRHCSEALAAIEAGKHVLVEKPLGLNATDAQLIVDAARTNRVVAGCAYYRRFFPRFSFVKQMLQRGELGRILSADICYQGWFDPSRDDPKYWRVVKSKSGGGPLTDVGSHMIDFVIGLLGMPVSVMADVSTLVQKYEVEDSVAAVMKMPDGASITARFSWCSKSFGHWLEIVGTEGRMRCDPFDSPTITKTMGREISQIELPNADNVHQPLVDDFTAAILEGHAPAIPVSEAIKTNRVMDAIYESGGTKREAIL